MASLPKSSICEQKYVVPLWFKDKEQREREISGIKPPLEWQGSTPSKVLSSGCDVSCLGISISCFSLVQQGNKVLSYSQSWTTALSLHRDRSSLFIEKAGRKVICAKPVDVLFLQSTSFYTPFPASRLQISLSTTIHCFVSGWHWRVFWSLLCILTQYCNYSVFIYWIWNHHVKYWFLASQLGW